jgi:hypothetical protein
LFSLNQFKTRAFAEEDNLEMAKILRMKVDVPTDDVLHQITALVTEVLQQASASVLESSWADDSCVPEQSPTYPWRCEAERRFFHRKGSD